MYSALRIFGFACIAVLVGAVLLPVNHNLGQAVGIVVFVTLTAVHVNNRERDARLARAEQRGQGVGIGS